MLPALPFDLPFALLHVNVFHHFPSHVSISLPSAVTTPNAVRRPPVQTLHPSIFQNCTPVSLFIPKNYPPGDVQGLTHLMKQSAPPFTLHTASLTSICAYSTDFHETETDVSHCASLLRALDAASEIKKLAALVPAPDCTSGEARQIHDFWYCGRYAKPQRIMLCYGDGGEKRAACCGS